jgi:hypothetical protein
MARKTLNSVRPVCINIGMFFKKSILFDKEFKKKNYYFSFIINPYYHLAILVKAPIKNSAHLRKCSELSGLHY